MSALMGAAGLTLFIRARRRGPDADRSRPRPPDVPALDDWISDLANSS